MAVPSHETILTLGRTDFIVCLGNIAELQADVLVGSTGTGSSGERGSYPGTVTWAIRQAGGSGIFEELRVHEPLAPGDVIVTSGGQLKAKYVYHAAVVGWRDQVRVLQATIWRAVSKCIALAQLMGISSVALPALGTGNAGAQRWETHSTIAAACLDTFRTDGSLRQVYFCFLNPAESNEFRRAFYQQQLIRELRGLSAGASEQDQLGAAFDRLYKRLLAPKSDVAEIKQLLEQAIASSSRTVANYVVTAYGSTVAVGDGARAVGEHAVLIDGDNTGDIDTVGTGP